VAAASSKSTLPAIERFKSFSKKEGIMNAIHWTLYCALLFFLALPSDGASGQLGGGGNSERAAVAKKDLQDAIDRAESMMGNPLQAGATAGAPQRACLCVGEIASPAVAKIEEALRAPLRSEGLTFIEVPLEKVVALLQEEYGISVQLDHAALDEIGLGPEEPVTVNIRNMSLESALRLMLRQLGLTYLIEHEVLMITSPEEAESELKVCVYDIRDLVEADQPKAMQALVDAIVSCAASDRWASQGGNGEIRPVPPNLLVISQTPGVHAEIRGLLAAIRKLRRSPAPVDAGGGETLRQPEPADEDSFRSF
jgi:hypothetical protein